MFTSMDGGLPPKACGEGGSEMGQSGGRGGVTSPALQLPAAGAKAANPLHDRACRVCGVHRSSMTVGLRHRHSG